MRASLPVLLASVLLPALLHGESATADGLTGKVLLPDCEKSDPADPSGLMCTAYIAGASDAFWLILLNQASPVLCLSQTVTYSWEQQIVVTWLREHPQDRHLPASVLVLKALTKAFPCAAEK